MAILFSALAPTMSHALPTSGAAGAMAQICSVNGARLVKLATDDRDKTPAIKHGAQHCLFCSTHSDAQALPSAPAVMLAAQLGRDVFPLLFYSAPQAAHVWSAANPRAPPFPA